MLFSFSFIFSGYDFTGSVKIGIQLFQDVILILKIL